MGSTKELWDVLMPYAILIVEDNESHAERIAEITEAMVEAEIDFAENRHDAWTKLRVTRYDVAIIDLDLKGLMEGRLLLESIRNRIDRPPGVVIISTYGHQPGNKELKAEFPFVSEVINKRDIDDLPRTFKLALHEALKLAGHSIGQGSAQFQVIPPNSNKVLIVHGHDEAKWREVKEIVRELGLEPIVVAQQPPGGAVSLIEHFENCAQECSYAIAVFTPDDEIRSEGEQYQQARPNVIFELGWFCGYLGRSRVTLLLKEGTSIFSDFSGILQKRFTENVSERASELRSDLVRAGLLKD